MAKVSKGRGLSKNVITITPEPGEIICIVLYDVRGHPHEVRVFNPSDRGVSQAVAFYPSLGYKTVLGSESRNLGIGSVRFEEMSD